jgi:hypothetical protein
MKTATLAVLALSIVAAALFPAAKDYTYVGASACKLCHKAELQGRQYTIWEAGPHAKSFTALTTPKALEVGKAAGVTNPAENAQCLGCHAPLAATARELKGEGVTCEVCHGPGSGYKKLSIMMDREQAVRNGLILYPAAGAIQAHCLKCHQNPHGNVFDFKTAWEKIKHPIPGK